MRRILLLLAAALCLAAPPVESQDLVLNRFRDYLEALRLQAGIPALAAAIVGSNTVAWEQAFGRQDVEQEIATRTDTPFQLDGLTQTFTAALVLRCVEEGRLSLDDRIGQFHPGSADASATIRQVLMHTFGTLSDPVFAYQPERLQTLDRPVKSCTGGSFRKTVSNLLERLAMVDSVPGADVIHLAPPAEGIPDDVAIARYTTALGRLATPYAVDRQHQITPSSYSATTLTPAGGLISTVRDLAQFYLALRNGLLLRPETLGLAWQPPVDSTGQRLPHAIGWFVQSYKGATVVWQFGVTENASSSLIVTIPARGLTLILLANSDGLVRPFRLSDGDVTASPFARVFLNLFVR